MTNGDELSDFPLSGDVAGQQDRTTRAAFARALPSTEGPPPGFGKDVNDYLNHYVTVADAKAAVMLGLSSVTILAVVGQSMPPGWPGTVRLLAVLLFASSLLLSVACLYPRSNSGGASLIFWEDVSARQSFSDYHRDTTRLDPSTVEQEYASQNWHVSRILVRLC